MYTHLHYLRLSPDVYAAAAKLKRFTASADLVVLGLLYYDGNDVARLGFPSLNLPSDAYSPLRVEYPGLAALAVRGLLRGEVAEAFYVYETSYQWLLVATATEFPPHLTYLPD